MGSSANCAANVVAMYDSFGKLLIVFGIILIILGAIFILFGKAGFFGNLPGDIHFRRQNVEFHFPLATCVVVSVVLSLLLTAFFKWFRK